MYLLVQLEVELRRSGAHASAPQGMKLMLPL